MISLYASADSDSPYLGLEMPPPDDYTNVADSFRMVNTWGFYNFVAPFGIGLLACCLLCCFSFVCKLDEYASRDFAGATTVVLFVGNFISFLANLVAAAVVRFGHTGRVCSGDYNSELSFFTLE